MGWTVISLRERSQQGAAKRAIEAAGARALALPGLRLEPLQAGAALEQALARRPTIALCISPAAVRFLLQLDPRIATRVAIGAGVGAGTAVALRRAGFAEVLAPIEQGPQISESLLAHPRLAQGAGETVLLVAAPGGRGVLAPELRARGFAVEEVQVYRRGPARLDARHARAVLTASAPLGLLLSSAEALDNVLVQLSAEAVATLKRARVAASSERLIEHARLRGFADTVLAEGPQPQALVSALAASAAR
ncbi:MAG: uroporphyrinogen-III synthase [Lysobacterales bacterium]